jgi:PAS domain S-box-containing protein
MTTLKPDPVRVLRDSFPLALVLFSVAMIMAASSLYLAYRAELADDHAWLVEVARNQASLIESVAAFDAETAGAEDPEVWLEGTLRQVSLAQAEARGWGETGQLHLVAMEADALVPLVEHRIPDRPSDQPRRHSPELERVLERALAGETGDEILSGLGGDRVLVAYRPVHLPGGPALGLATTLDVAETRAPFVRLGLLLGTVALLLIVLGSITTGWLTQPARRALEESERRYRLLFEDSAEAIVITGVDGTIVECNGAAAELLGGSREEVVGSSSTTYYRDPRQREVLLAQLQLHGRVQGMELHLVRPDGSEFTCLATAHYRRGTNAGEGVLEVLLTDITDRKSAEEALTASEARYFDMFEHAPDMLLSVDTGTNLVRECNQTVLQRTGFSKEDILERPLLALFSPDSAETAREVLELVRTTGAAEGAEVDLLLKDGSSIPVSVNALGVKDGEGELVATRFSFRDLTETREMAARLERILEGTQDGFWEWPDLSREELWWSPTFFELLGYEPGEFQPTLERYNELTHPEDRDEVNARAAEYVRVGGTFESEYRIRRKDGRYAWFQAKGQVYRDHEGRPTRMAGSVRAITAQKEAEEALRDRERFLKAIFDGAQNGIMVADDQGNFLSANQAAADLLGYSLDELLRMKVGDLEIVERPGAQERYAQYLKMGRESGEFEFVRPDGGARAARYNAVRVRDDFNLSIMEDVTKQRAVEDALRESENFFRQVVKGVEGGIVVLDREFRCTLWNRYMERMSGLPAEAVLGRKPEELFPFVVAEGVDEALKRALMGETVTLPPHPYEMPQSGRKGWASDGFSPLLDADGQVVGVLGSAMDITKVREAEDREREAGERARLYLDTVEQIMVGLDAEGCVEMINRKGCEVLGYEEAELLGKDWAETALHHSVRDELRQTYRGILTGKLEPAIYVEREVLTKGGEKRLVAWHNSYLRDDEGRITGSVSSGQDITELRKVEASLEVSEDRLRSVFASVRAGVLLQAAGGEILYANAEAEEILGLSSQELQGKTSQDPGWEMIDQEGRPVLGRDHPSMITLRTGEPIRGAVRGLYSGDPARTRWLLVNTEPRLGPDGEKVEEVVTTFQDITELRGAEEALQRERDKSQHYLDVAEVMLVALDREGRIEMINRKGCEVLEASEAELLGRNWFETALPPETVPAVRSVFGKLMAGDVEPVEYFENEIVTSTGRVRVMAWHNSILKTEDGEIRGIFSSGEDITAAKQAREALVESEERYRQLFEGMQEGFAVHEMIWDEEGNPADYRFLAVNPAFERLTGLRKEELLGKRVREIVPLTEPEWIERYGEVARTGTPMQFESSSVALGRHYRVSAFRPEKNRFAVSFSDISQRVRAEEERVANEERLSLAQRVGRIGLMDRDMVRDEEVWSDTTFEILGMDPETTTPGPAAWTRAVHPEDRSRAIRFLGRLLHGEEVDAEDFRVLRPDGGICWARVVARVFPSEDGKPLGRILGTVQDITELREAEEGLRESEERFRGVFEASPVGIALAGPDERMVEVNRRFAEILGYDASELLGRTPSDITHPDDLANTEEMNQALLEGKSSGRQAEKRYLRKDGTPVWCRLTTSAIRGRDGALSLGLGMIQDISRERRSKERLLQTQERLRALASRLTRIREDERTAISRELHDELGQTLTGLRMDLAMERSDLPEAEEALRDRFQRLIETTDENIDLVRDLSSRLRPPILDVLGLGPAIEWQVDEYRPRTSIQFHLDLPEDEPRLPDHHRVALFRIAQESMTNIFRHSGAGRVWVTLKYSGGSIRLQVEDDGKGVSPEDLGAIRSLGLLGMEERALGIGGTFSVGPREGGGTVVLATAPVPEEGKEEEPTMGGPQ